MTDKNKLIFWDIGTFTKISNKNLEANGNYQIAENIPLLMKNDGYLKITEFKELDVIEKIDLTACTVCWERKIMFLGMKGQKLGSSDMRNFKIIR